jgi:hypothetical protein
MKYTFDNFIVLILQAFEILSSQAISDQAVHGRLWIVLFLWVFRQLLRNLGRSMKGMLCAAFPILTCRNISGSDVTEGDRIRINLQNGELTNLRTGKIIPAEPFSEVQYEIYKNGGLL